MNKTNPNHSSSVQHRSVQKSTTLNRRYVKRPQPMVKKIRVCDEADEADEVIVKKKIAVAEADVSPVKNKIVVAEAGVTSVKNKISVTDEASAEKCKPVKKVTISSNEISSDNLEQAIQEAKDLDLRSPMISRFYDAPLSVAPSAILANNYATPVSTHKKTTVEVDCVDVEPAAELELENAIAKARVDEMEMAAAIRDELESVAAAEPEDLPPAPNPYQAAIDARMNAMEVRKMAGRTAEFYDGPTPEELKNAEIEKALAKVARANEVESVSLKKVSISSRAEIKAQKAEVARKERAERIAAKKAQKLEKVDRAAKLAEESRQAKLAKKSRRAVANEKAAKSESLLEKNVRPESEMSRGLRKKRNGKRLALAAVCSIACVVALGALVYNNIPDISVKVTAMQSGIDAQYPSYVPRDFSLGGVYIDEEGAVVMDFVGPENSKFSIKETQSSWDSTALLNNYVKRKWSADEYTTMRENGVTIYISDSCAAWVNGGMLYQIAAMNGVLTKKQIKNIVTSM